MYDLHLELQAEFYKVLLETEFKSAAIFSGFFVICSNQAETLFSN